MRKDDVKILGVIFVLSSILITGCTSSQSFLFHLTDRNNMPVTNASVMVTDPQSTLQFNFTDENGNALFVNKGSGNYKFTVTNLQEGQTCPYSIVLSDSDNLQINETICPAQIPSQKLDQTVNRVQQGTDLANTIGNAARLNP